MKIRERPMSFTRRLTVTSLAIAVTMILAACGGDDETDADAGQDRNEHVWKDKTGAIDKARGVERVLDKSRK
jgi:hypothetical protein